MSNKNTSKLRTGLDVVLARRTPAGETVQVIPVAYRDLENVIGFKN